MKNLHDCFHPLSVFCALSSCFAGKLRILGGDPVDPFLDRAGCLESHGFRDLCQSETHLPHFEDPHIRFGQALLELVDGRLFNDLLFKFRFGIGYVKASVSIDVRPMYSKLE